MKTEYTVQCLGTGEEVADNDLPLTNPNSPKPAFLRAVYAKKQIEPGEETEGLYRFADWLPIQRRLSGSGAPVTYKSERLANELGLKNLYITFNGYWPERGARMLTGTFKECEAYSVCARMPEGYERTLVVASVGNTSRAFARVCSANNIPLVVVVPERCIDSMWYTGEVRSCVKLIAAGDDSDYFDAITLAEFLCGSEGFFSEGGAKNIARRDGMGTTVLSAVTTIGEIPEYYFQAVGSGTGAIAAWEANLRLIRDGRFGSRKMKLMVSQNAPFLLLHDSWKRGTRDLVEVDSDTARGFSNQIQAKVLSNRKPPYSITGGLFDALSDTAGDVIPVTNEEAFEGADMFLNLEGIDVTPAAAVAIASLIKSIRKQRLDVTSLIMLNVTGGGIRRLQEEHEILHLTPCRVVERNNITQEYAAKLAEEIKGDN